MHHGDGDPAGDASGDPPGAARRQEAVWQDVVEAVPGVVLVLNADQVCTYVSPAVERELGVRACDVVGTCPDRLEDPDQLPDVWRARIAAATGERGATSRVLLPGPHGPVWYRSTSTRLVHPVTGAVSTVVHLQDVAGEVASQVALTRSIDRYRCLLEAVDEAVLQLDARGRIESFNPQALDLLHRSPDGLLGALAVTVLGLCDQDGRPIGGDLAQALAPATGAGVWRTLVRGDGERRLVRVRLTSFGGPGPGGGGDLLVLRECAGHGAPPGRPGPTPREARSAAGLTAREGDVLDGLARGGDVPTIARMLGISVHSVRGHVKSITAKLGVHSQLQAVIAAAQRGLVDLTQPD